MLKQWIAEQLKKIEAVPVRSYYNTHIDAIKRVYGKDVAEHVQKIQLQAKKFTNGLR